MSQKPRKGFYMTTQTVVAQDCVALISYHDIPCLNSPSRAGRFWELLGNSFPLFNTEECAWEKFGELKAQWEQAKGWTYFGPFTSEEEAVAYLDQFGFTRTQEEVEYDGMPPIFETTWVWSYKGSDVKWQLRKISSSQIQRWSENEPDWRICPLSEIPEDRLYPAAVIARKELQSLER